MKTKVEIPPKLRPIMFLMFGLGSRKPWENAVFGFLGRGWRHVAFVFPADGVSSRKGFAIGERWLAGWAA